MFPLGLLKRGESGKIAVTFPIKKDIGVGLSVSEAAFVCRLEELGIRFGADIEVLNNSGNGTMVVKIENSRIAFPHKISMKILVRRNK